MAWVRDTDFILLAILMSAAKNDSPWLVPTFRLTPLNNWSA